MKEYIEREAFAAEMKKRKDAAKEWLIEATGTDDADGKVRAETILSFLCEVKLTLDSIHAADVRPVVHGKWKNVKTGYICTNCKKHPGTMHGKQGAFLSNFCPNCGADMRGD